MAIVRRINEANFEEAFARMDRDCYSHEGYKYLYDFYEEISQAQEKDVELDVVAVCCDWNEYENFSRLDDDYHYLIDREDGESDKDYQKRLIAELEGKTIFVKLSNGHFLLHVF